MPGSVIPPGQWGGDQQFYSISDFLIHWNDNNQDYGVVLAPHIQAGVSDGSTYATGGGNGSPGSLYQAPNIPFDEVYAGMDNSFKAPGVLPGAQGERSNQPVWLAPGGALLGAGTVSVAVTGDGITTPMYTITDLFSAPAGFLATGDVTVFASSYVCANGIVVGTGTFASPNMGGVPEPGTFVLVAPALVLFWFGRRLIRERRLL